MMAFCGVNKMNWRINNSNWISLTERKNNKYWNKKSHHTPCRTEPRINKYFIPIVFGSQSKV